MNTSTSIHLRFPRQRYVVLLLILCCVTLAPAHQTARSIFVQPKTPYEPSTDPDTSSYNADYDILEEIIEEAEHLVSNQLNSLEGLKRFRLAGLLGHSGALATVAALSLIGDGQIPRDIPSAVRHLNLAAQAGQPDAHALLGSLHASGLADRYGVPKSSARAILYWTVAAESGNIYASTALAFRHLYGIGMEKSCILAARHYRRAARAIATDPRFWPSGSNFVEGKPPLPSDLVGTPVVRLNDTTINGENHIESDQDIVQFYRHSAERRDHNSRTILGALYYFGGHGIEPDAREARVHLDIAADAGNGEAHAILGHMDMRNHNNESAYKHFMYSASHQTDLGHYALGMIHRHGLLGFKEDLSKAAMHFQLAIEKEKHGGAYFELGLLYWTGNGVARNIDEAYKCFQVGAKLGNLQSKLNLGTILVDGTAPVGEVHCKRGVTLLKEVAEEGEWRTLFDLAMERVHDGDWYGALHRFLEAGHAGIELGQHNAAFLLESKTLADFPELQHWDRKRMLKEAHELYELSSLQGHTDSLIRSANVMYSELKDYAQAARTFKKAARLENGEGMVSLGLMHAQGLGVEQNRKRAIAYLQLASTSSKNEAFAPAKVAILGLHIYWALEDLYMSANRITIWMPLVLANNEAVNTENIGDVYQEQQQHQKQRNARQGSLLVQNRRFLYNYSGDVAVVGFLVVALLMVLILRTKRLAVRARREPIEIVNTQSEHET